MNVMEFSTGSSYMNGKQTSKLSTSTDEGKRAIGKTYRSSHSNGKQISSFVNHAAIAWHEGRRKWVGDKSQRPPKMPKDPIISWSTSYEELLSTNERFAEPIPLPEMVDFLVDIWQDEGLFDLILS